MFGISPEFLKGAQERLVKFGESVMDGAKAIPGKASNLADRVVEGANDAAQAVKTATASPGAAGQTLGKGVGATVNKAGEVIDQVVAGTKEAATGAKEGYQEVRNPSRRLSKERRYELKNGAPKLDQRTTGQFYQTSGEEMWHRQAAQEKIVNTRASQKQGIPTGSPDSLDRESIKRRLDLSRRNAEGKKAPKTKAQKIFEKQRQDEAIRTRAAKETAEESIHGKMGSVGRAVKTSAAGAYDSVFAGANEKGRVFTKDFSSTLMKNMAIGGITGGGASMVKSFAGMVDPNTQSGDGGPGIMKSAAMGMIGGAALTAFKPIGAGLQKGMTSSSSPRLQNFATMTHNASQHWSTRGALAMAAGGYGASGMSLTGAINRNRGTQQ